jgi:hypothetical protein
MHQSQGHIANHVEVLSCLLSEKEGKAQGEQFPNFKLHEALRQLSLSGFDVRKVRSRVPTDGP